MSDLQAIARLRRLLDLPLTEETREALNRAIRVMMEKVEEKRERRSA